MSNTIDIAAPKAKFTFPFFTRSKKEPADKTDKIREQIREMVKDYPKIYPTPRFIKEVLADKNTSIEELQKAKNNFKDFFDVVAFVGKINQQS